MADCLRFLNSTNLGISCWVKEAAETRLFSFTSMLFFNNIWQRKYYPTFLLLWLLGTNVPDCLAQVPQLFSYPKEQRALKLHGLIMAVERTAELRVAIYDSAFNIAHEKGDERLALYARLLKAVESASHATATPVTQTLLWQEKNLFEKAPFADIRASYTFYLGEAYYFRSNFENAFHYLIEATHQFEKIGYDQLPLAGWFAIVLFGMYYDFADYATALQFLKIGLLHPYPRVHSELFLRNNMGVTYLKLKEVNKAQAQFAKVMELAKVANDSVYLGIGSGNYGNTLRLQGSFRAALPYLYLDVSLNEKAVPENSAITCAYIANCLLQLDSVDKAANYLRQAEGLKVDWNRSSFYPPFFEAKALYYKKKGAYREASLYQDSLLSLKDSLKEKFNTSLLLTTSLTLKEERRLAEQRQKELEALRVRLVRNVVVASLLLLFTLVIVVMWRKRKKERIKLLTVQQQAEEKLRHAEEQLSQYLQIIKERNQFIEQIEREKTMLSERPAVTSTSESTSEQLLTNFSLLTEADWQQFKILFAAVHPQFFERIVERYANLSPAEQRLLALLKLSLSSQDTASMLGISLQSLRTSRYRLRKKYPALMEDEEFKDLV